MPDWPESLTRRRWPSKGLTTVKSAIWLSYDLGVNGDYEGMYAWLDNHGAKECGGSVAYLQFTHDGDLPASLGATSRAWLP